MRLGLISDTHGMLRNEVLDHFSGVERVLHAGDIGDPGILVALAALAPVDAVWGNTDGFDLRNSVPESVRLECQGRTLLLVHGHQIGAPTPSRLAREYPDADIIVFGHTHRPAEERLNGRLFLNPGGAGAPRFGLKPSIALLDIDRAGEVFRLIEL